MMHPRTLKCVETLKTAIKCTYFHYESYTYYVSTLPGKKIRVLFLNIAENIFTTRI
jgi:hypothetical protein